MDEPFASVDAQTRFDLEDLILKVRRELGITVVLVTHDIDEAIYLERPDRRALQEPEHRERGRRCSASGRSDRRSRPARATSSSELRNHLLSLVMPKDA